MSFIFWIGLSLLVGYYASRRGRSMIAWTIISLLISPIFAAIIVAIMRDLTLEQRIQRNNMDNDRLKERMAISESTMNSRMDNMEQRLDRVDGGRSAIAASEQPGLLKEGLSPDWKYCPYCGQKTELAAAFCPNCGSPLAVVTMEECPHCHEMVRSDAQSCPHCHQVIHP